MMRQDGLRVPVWEVKINRNPSASCMNKISLLTNNRCNSEHEFRKNLGHETYAQEIWAWNMPVQSVLTHEVVFAKLFPQ